MAKTYGNAPVDLEASDFLTKPGWYHLLILKIDETPLNADKSVQEAIYIECRAVAGTVPDEIGKPWRTWLRDPSPAMEGIDRLRLKVQLRLARALGILPEYAAGGSVTVDWPAGEKRSCVVKLSTWVNDKGKEILQIDGAHIFHVLDPDVKDIPKYEQLAALAPVLPASQHAKPKESAPPAAAPTTPPAASPLDKSGPVSLDDL